MLVCVARLSDYALLAQVKHLAQREREVTVALIVHLAEIDERRLYLAEGYPSLFKYCTNVLHLSEHATYNRIEAARAARRFPVLLEHLAAGWLNLFAVRLLAPLLTPGESPRRARPGALQEQTRNRRTRRPAAPPASGPRCGAQAPDPDAGGEHGATEPLPGWRHH